MSPIPPFINDSETKIETISGIFLKHNFFFNGTQDNLKTFLVSAILIYVTHKAQGNQIYFRFVE